jgi:predicted small lipoprotein YifL
MSWGTDLTTTFSRTALIAALAAGLLLAGCGRKGGLEAPPSASLANPPASAQPTLGEPEHDALEGERRPAAERAAAAQKKSFPLDFLVTGERERERERMREQRAKDEAAAPRR